MGAANFNGQNDWADITVSVKGGLTPPPLQSRKVYASEQRGTQ